MARPIKNNCDYFTHDAGMRNHKKVKALRSKFGVTGYAVWNMLLEHLTGSDGNVFPYTDLEFELMSGDFGVSATEIRSIVDYCILLELLFNQNNFINSESLDERLAPVFAKRNKAKELSKQQLRANGKYVSSNTDDTVVSVAETPQSKVKEIRVEEIKGNETEKKQKGNPEIFLSKSFSDDFYKNPEQAFEEIKNDELQMEKLLLIVHRSGFRTCTYFTLTLAIRNFITIEGAKPDFTNRSRGELKRHLVNWINKNAKDLQQYAA